MSVIVDDNLELVEVESSQVQVTLGTGTPFYIRLRPRSVYIANIHTVHVHIHVCVHVKQHASHVWTCYMYSACTFTGQDIQKHVHTKQMSCMYGKQCKAVITKNIIYRFIEKWQIYHSGRIIYVYTCTLYRCTVVYFSFWYMHSDPTCMSLMVYTTEL